MSDQFGNRRVQSHRRCLLSIILLAVSGLGLSAWLTVIHVRVHLDPLYESVCAFGARLNCETVAASTYSVVAGIPISVIGILFYLVVAIVGFVEWVDRKGGAHVMLVASLAGGGALGAVVLGALSFAVIGAVCLACTATYLINFALFACTVRRVRFFGGWRACGTREIHALRRNRWPAVYAATILLLLLAAGPGGGFPRYYELASWRQGVPSPHGISDEGLPWIGATRPKLVVHEYFDFNCPACRLSHKKLRRLLGNHPDRLRIVRHDTSRTPCATRDEKGEPWRCATAKVGYCAGLSGRYWEWNDAVIAHPKPSNMFNRLDYEWTMAKRLGFDMEKLAPCVNAPATGQFVQKSYLDAMKAGVKATPTYLVDGKRCTLHELRERISGWN